MSKFLIDKFIVKIIYHKKRENNIHFDNPIETVFESNIVSNHQRLHNHNMTCAIFHFLFRLNNQIMTIFYQMYLKWYMLIQQFNECTRRNLFLDYIIWPSHTIKYILGITLKSKTYSNFISIVIILRNYQFYCNKGYCLPNI